LNEATCGVTAAALGAQRIAAKSCVAMLLKLQRDEAAAYLAAAKVANHQRSLPFAVRRWLSAPCGIGTTMNKISIFALLTLILLPSFTMAAEVTPGSSKSTPFYGDAGGAVNILPNVNWQINTILAGPTNLKTTMNPEGTGTQMPVSYASFSTSANTVTFKTTNTQAFYVGAIFYVYPEGAAAFPSSAYRVTAMAPNTSITTTLPLGLRSPAVSHGGLLIPLGVVGPQGGGGTLAFDGGWQVSPSTLLFWADDFRANQYPGGVRALGIRKDISAPEYFYWNGGPPSDLPRYSGRAITCGAVVYQKAQHGGGTWKLTLNDGVSGVVSSTPGTGASVGGYEFRSVTMTTSRNATKFLFNLELDGKASDIYYMALPTCVFGSSLAQDNLAQKPQEYIQVVNHWNPPLLTPLSGAFPPTSFDGCAGPGCLYGWDNQDIEAMSYRQVHNSVKALKLKLECTFTSPGAVFFVGKAPAQNWTFGPECTAVPYGYQSMAAGVVSVYNGGLINFFTATPGLWVANITFDFDDIALASP
jgi:hypothetical protein